MYKKKFIYYIDTCWHNIQSFNIVLALNTLFMCDSDHILYFKGLACVYYEIYCTLLWIIVLLEYKIIIAIQV